MEYVEDKENTLPQTSSDPLLFKTGTPSPRRAARKGRSKSIGPGGLGEIDDTAKLDAKQVAKNRRKSTYVPATKAIISSDVEKAERQAARRKTLANRRVSFAPEATLHTWDVVEFMRDQTTSTDSDSTRRTSKGSPFKRATTPDSEMEDEDDEDSVQVSSSPAQPNRARRNSGFPAQLMSDSDDGSSDAEEGSEGSEDDAPGSDDDTGTAMSLDIDNVTAQSVGASEGNSTDSSGRLEAALRQAAEAAGTRGIEYDEYGDASMELAGDEVTNAFKAWTEDRAANQPPGSASLDQENVNPFSPAFKAQLISGVVNRPATVEEENTGDLSMDMTRAVGGIIRQPPAMEAETSLLGDGTMDLTQAVGKIQQQQQQAPSPRGQKRRRSTNDVGSPAAAVSSNQSKRRRSSVARSSMGGDDTMDLTMAMGHIKSNGSPTKSERRKSVGRRRSSGVTSEPDEATMDFTQAVGGVKSVARAEHTGSSFDENEELTMELTTVLGGIQSIGRVAASTQPMTPQQQSPVNPKVNTTPKDQERFKDAPDSGPKKLLTPIFQKQVLHSADKTRSSGKSQQLASPSRVAFPAIVGTPLAVPQSNTGTPKSSPAKTQLTTPQKPSLRDHQSPVKTTPRITPVQSPARPRNNATPDSVQRQQLDAQLHSIQQSPPGQRQPSPSPMRIPSTPQQPSEPTQDGRRLAASIKLMSTPRKETLKTTVTPKPQPQPSPQVAPASRTRPTPRAKVNATTSPAKQLSEDMARIAASEGNAAERIQLQEFLDAAGIRFMDLTTTKRRMTTAITPSKAKRAGELQTADEESEATLESAVVAGSCTLPELEMYEHACHELRRYISDGKRVVKELESATAKDTPPLIQAYIAAGTKRKAVMDAQMRDIKTHARYRSKEMWYAWRAQLLEDLLKALQSIAERSLKDDETLSSAEAVLDEVLPGLVEQQEVLQQTAENLEREVADTNEEDQEELEAARERLLEADQLVQERQRVLEELQAEFDEQQAKANDLQETKEEVGAAIREADHVREACRGVSTNEIASLQASVRQLEDSSGWSMRSASSSPPTVTMTYKSQLQLYFRPTAFSSHRAGQQNAPISLIYTSSDQPGTTLRFFLQLLRASLQALPQSSTRVPSLLTLVSNGWETALAVAEAERRLNLEVPTESRIVSDEKLAITSSILLPRVRSKVRVTFEVEASVVGAGGEDDGEMEVRTSVVPSVKVVYGEGYNEKKMGEFVAKGIAEGFEGWDATVRELREKLIARGPKGGRQ